jgi:hypothetical protein
VVIVPDSATEKLQMLARRHATDTSETAKSEMMTGIRLLFDPAIMKLYKDIMGYSLYMIIESSAVDIYSGAFMEALQAHISEQFDSFRKDLVPAGLKSFPGILPLSGSPPAILAWRNRSALKRESPEDANLSLNTTLSATMYPPLYCLPCSLLSSPWRAVS